MATLDMQIRQAMRIPVKLWVTSSLLGFITWICSAVRHNLLQSNAYDLGLFDQWAWLISRGLPPISSMEDVHILADHFAWLMYLAGAAYRVIPSPQWLLASQSLALSLTAIPIWCLAKEAGLSNERCWLACGLWWLQPVVFNTALFDFHPETWMMPIFALALLAERLQAPRLWFSLLILMLGARDGLLLITSGMSLDLALRRRWSWSFASASLSFSWLLMLSFWIYPLMKEGEGPKAAERMFNHLRGSPLSIIQSIDWQAGLIYILILIIPCFWLWRKSSITTLTIGIPLVLVNLLSSSSTYRTLIHHYSLPLALVAVVASIDGLMNSQTGPSITINYWILAWATACWLALAKPGFFTGPYLQRLEMIEDSQELIGLINPQEAVLTTSYLVPHISHRKKIAFPKNSFQKDLSDTKWTTLLLNPSDPGWGSSSQLQRELLRQARNQNWHCTESQSNLILCKISQASQNK